MMLQAEALGHTVAGRDLWGDLSFDLHQGEILAVRGKSGSGKSTLLRVLANLIPRTTGTVLLQGQSIDDVSPTQWRQQVRFVSQAPTPYAGTPTQTWKRLLHLFKDADPKPIAAEWDITGAQWEQPWSALSGGERQRIILAMALATEPRVLLLDEPTSALDPATTALVEDHLRGRTAVWVTHDQAQSNRVATREIVL